MAAKRRSPFDGLVRGGDFTEAEQLLASVIVTMARGGGTMFRGRRAECQVALALGARHPELGTSSWDLKLPDDRTVEVKSAKAGGSFSIGRASRDVDLWVFVHCGATEQDDEYTIVTDATVEEQRKRFRAERRSAARLSSPVVRAWGVHPASDLRLALRRLNA